MAGGYIHAQALINRLLTFISQDTQFAGRKELTDTEKEREATRCISLSAPSAHTSGPDSQRWSGSEAVSVRPNCDRDNNVTSNMIRTICSQCSSQSDESSERKSIVSMLVAVQAVKEIFRAFRLRFHITPADNNFTTRTRKDTNTEGKNNMNRILKKFRIFLL